MTSAAASSLCFSHVAREATQSALLTCYAIYWLQKLARLLEICTTGTDRQQTNEFHLFSFLLNAAMFCIELAIVIQKCDLAQLFRCHFQFLINHLLLIRLQVL